MSRLPELLDAPSPSGLANLGGTWDAAILDACREFAGLNDDVKPMVRAEMTCDRSWAIVGWAEGMASLAVRERDREQLVLGLVGLSLFDPADFDARDALVVYPLFVRAAELIGEDPHDVTGAAAELTDSIGRSWLLALLPSRNHRMDETHEEFGSGRDFAFRRRGGGWDPEVELKEFKEGD